MLRIVLLTLSVGVSAASGAAACVPGRFTGEAQVAGQPAFPVVVTIVCTEGAVAGEVESRFGVNPITGGQSGEAAFALLVDQDGLTITLAVERAGDAWRGTFSAGPRTGALTLVPDHSTTYAELVADPPERTDLDTGAWAEDLGFIEGEVALRHANAFHSLKQDAWYDATDSLRQRLASLSDTEVPVALRQLVARIGDGHTALQLPAAVGRLPVGLFRFDDGLRIVRAAAGYETLLGARLRTIGGISIAEAEGRIGTLVPPENRWAVLAAVPYFMVRQDVLDYFNLIPPEGEALLGVEMPDGTLREVAVPFGPRPDFADWRFVAGEPPLWQQEPDQALFWRSLDDGTLYVNFRRYDGLGARIAALMAEIDRLTPQRVALDMRDNGGGDFKLFRRLVLPELTARDWLNRGDRLFVLIGREMFSAAMTNAADLRLQTNATLVGEPIGERPNSYQELQRLILPNSHLKLGVSTAYYEALPGEGDPDAIHPDLACPPSWAAYSQGRDDALDCARGHLP